MIINNNCEAVMTRQVKDKQALPNPVSAILMLPCAALWGRRMTINATHEATQDNKTKHMIRRMTNRHDGWQCYTTYYNLTKKCRLLLPYCRQRHYQVYDKCHATFLFVSCQMAMRSVTWSVLLWCVDKGLLIRHMTIWHDAWQYDATYDIL